MPFSSVDDGFSGNGHGRRLGTQEVEATDEVDVAVACQAERGGEREVASSALSRHDDPTRVDTEHLVVGGHPPTPDTQSLSPAGKGATSGADDGSRALRKSTMATATPWPAMICPQAR